MRIVALRTLSSTFPQLLPRFRRATFSARFTFRCQRIFTATHSRTYRHFANCGIHSAGSRSDFDRFDDADTATNDRRSPRSFANRIRVSAFHLFAPESHASASGTMWSMSKFVECSVTTRS